MVEDAQASSQNDLDNDGFLNEIQKWTRERAHELAVLNDLGPLNDDHWKIIDYVGAVAKLDGKTDA